jgi:UDP-4-amino-4,6-dideoxy-N-acetyl-beta-L-altrosamine transaminase
LTDKNNFIPYGRQWIDEDDIRAVVGVLKSDWLTQGPKIEEFERQISAYCGVQHAVVFNSGTSALHGAYFAVGLEKDDEFITTPLTFVATANAGVYLGARPVFVDIQEDTGNIDASKIEPEISLKTKLVAPVHYAGHPVDLVAISKIAKKHGLFVVEDACHAMGSMFKGEETGNCKYSDMTVFSFHPVKHITTGEGGAVVTNNPDFYERLLMFRSHGITKRNLIYEPHGEWYYEMQLLGYNYRMTDIQAALGASQLRKLDVFVDRRRKIADTYNEAFAGNPFFDVPVERDYVFSAYHLYPLRIKDRHRNMKKEIAIALKEKGIGTQVHYVPVYQHPFYRELGYENGLCPVAEDFYQRELSIPLYPAMSDDEVRYVEKAVSEVFGGFK